MASALLGKVHRHGKRVTKPNRDTDAVFEIEIRVAPSRRHCTHARARRLVAAALGLPQSESAAVLVRTVDKVARLLHARDRLLLRWQLADDGIHVRADGSY